MSDELSKIALFEQKEIRKILHGGEWWFVITDVVAALSESTDPARYLRNLRLRDPEFAKLFDQAVDKGASQIETPLHSPLRLKEVCKNYPVGIPREYFDSSSLFQVRMQSR